MFVIPLAVRLSKRFPRNSKLEKEWLKPGPADGELVSQKLLYKLPDDFARDLKARIKVRVGQDHALTRTA